jgi:hypothetical protein
MIKTYAMPVSTESWQGMKTEGRPDLRTHELLNVTLHVPLDAGHSLVTWRNDCQPNLPWADIHFEERVGGVPLNPAPSWREWPWAPSAKRFHDSEEVFDHTYPERFWPKHADGDLHKIRNGSPNIGIRFEYGDLMDVVRLLVREPHTRQAFLPIFFPEDTSPEAKRKPCTIGYHFIVRNHRLHCFYPMRSCDFVRHWADDAYLAVRLMLWVIEICRNIELQTEDAMNIRWLNTTLGTLTMHMTSLHVFANDMRSL